MSIYTFRRLAIALVFFACISFPTSSLKADENCLNPESVRSVLESLERIQDSVPRSPDSPPFARNLEEESCHRARYSRGRQNIIVFHNPADRSGAASGILVGEARHSQEEANQCVNYAARGLASLRPWYANILAENRRMQSWRWADPDIGQVRWLQCQTTELRSQVSNLAMFAHELNHENRNGSCLYHPRTPRSICLGPTSLFNVGGFRPTLTF